MRHLAFIVAFAIGVAAPAYAQSTVNENLRASAIKDAEAALAALQEGDYAKAETSLEFASKNTRQLKIRNISSRIAAKAPAISANDIKFALAGSSTLSFDAFQAINDAGETSYTDEEGRTVTVRIFSDETALEAFETVSADAPMLESKNLEAVMMAGAPAIKKRGEGGALSVLMMSEADHALIEIDGDSEDAVMALIEKLEK